MPKKLYRNSFPQDKDASKKFHDEEYNFQNEEQEAKRTKVDQEPIMEGINVNLQSINAGKLKDIKYGTPKEILDRSVEFMHSWSNYCKSLNCPGMDEDIKHRLTYFPLDVQEYLSLMLINKSKISEKINGQLVPGYYDETNNFCSSVNWRNWKYTSLLYILLLLKSERHNKPIP